MHELLQGFLGLFEGMWTILNSFIYFVALYILQIKIISTTAFFKMKIS